MGRTFSADLQCRSDKLQMKRGKAEQIPRENLRLQGSSKKVLAKPMCNPGPKVAIQGGMCSTTSGTSAHAMLNDWLRTTQ